MSKGKDNDKDYTIPARYRRTLTMIDGREHIKIQGQFVPLEGEGSVRPLTELGIKKIGKYKRAKSCSIVTQAQQTIPLKKDGLLIVSLYDRSGVMIEPWREQKVNGKVINKGNVCVTIDLGDKLYSDDYKNCFHFALDALVVDPCDILSQFGNGTCDVFFAFPPCTDWSKAGTGSVKKKFWNDRYWLRRAMMLVDAARNWATHSKFWMIENPVGSLRKAWRRGDWTFDPYEYAGYERDLVHQFLNYVTKRTEIWSNFPKPPSKLACFHGQKVIVPELLQDWEFDIPVSRKPFTFDKPTNKGGKRYREFAIVKQEVFRRYDPENPWLTTWKPTEGLGAGREDADAKPEIHFWRSLLPSGFAKAVYRELHRIKVPTKVTEYQTSPMYTAPIAAPSKRVIKNPKQGRAMIQLYQTGETHDSGYPVFRPIGIEPKRGKLGLGGEYYVRVGPSGRGILSQYDQARLARGESIHNMYKAGRAYRDRIGTHDGEFEYEITDYVIVNQNPTSGIFTPAQQQKYDKIVRIVPFDERERLKAFTEQHAERLIGTIPQSYIDESKRELGHRLRQYDYLDWSDERNPTKLEYAIDVMREYLILRYLLESDVATLPDGSSFVAGTKLRKNGRNLGYGTNNGAMVKNQLQTIQRTASQLNAILEHSDELPDWVLTKVSTAMDRLVVSFNYIQSKLQGMKPNPRVNVSAAIKNAQTVIREIR